MDFIDAAQTGQYAALTTQFPSMVAHTLPPGHPGTEFAPARVLDAALDCAAKEHLAFQLPQRERPALLTAVGEHDLLALRTLRTAISRCRRNPSPDLEFTSNN